MSILGRLALLFVIVPLLELALLIQMGQWVGYWPTIGLVVFTGVAGAWLARMEIKVVFEELLRRVVRIERDGPIEWLRSNFISGIKHLRVRVVELAA